MEDDDNTDNSNLEQDSYILSKVKISDNSKNDGQLLSRYTVVSQNFNEEPSSIKDQSYINSKRIDSMDSSKNSKDLKNGEKKKKKKESKKIKVKEEKNLINFKVIMLGTVSVGKTSIIGRYIENSFREDYKCTIQAEQRTKTINIDSNTSIILDIFDTAGQERYHAITRQYYHDKHGAIIVFDLTNQKSFEKIRDWINELKTFSNEDTEIIILGNKSDLVDKREIPQNDINNFIKEEYPYFEVSAKNGNNISLAFDKIIKLMMRIKNHKNGKNEDNRKHSLSRMSKNIHEKNKRCC